MDKKELVIVASLLISTFIGSALAGPLLNRAITPPPPEPEPVSQTGSMDIELFKSLGNDTAVYIYHDSDGNQTSFFAAFSFIPPKGFTKATYLILTLSYKSGFYAPPRTLLLRLNTMEDFNLAGISPRNTGPTSQITIGTASDANCANCVKPALFEIIRVGINTIEILPNLDPPPATDLFLYEVRLTLEYTFVA